MLLPEATIQRVKGFSASLLPSGLAGYFSSSGGHRSPVYLTGKGPAGHQPGQVLEALSRHILNLPIRNSLGHRLSSPTNLPGELSFERSSTAWNMKVAEIAGRGITVKELLGFYSFWVAKPK